MEELDTKVSLKQVLVYISLTLVLMAIAFGLGRYTVKPVAVIKEVVRVDSVYITRYKADSASLKRIKAFLDSTNKTYTKKPNQVLNDIRQWYKDNE